MCKGFRAGYGEKVAKNDEDEIYTKCWKCLILRVFQRIYLIGFANQAENALDQVIVFRMRASLNRSLIC